MQDPSLGHLLCTFKRITEPVARYRRSVCVLGAEMEHDVKLGETWRNLEKLERGTAWCGLCAAARVCSCAPCRSNGTRTSNKGSRMVISARGALFHPGPLCVQYPQRSPKGGASLSSKCLSSARCRFAEKKLHGEGDRIGDDDRWPSGHHARWLPQRDLPARVRCRCPRQRYQCASALAPMPCCCPSSPLPRARPSPLSRASRHKGLQQASRRANLLARSVPGRLEQGAG